MYPDTQTVPFVVIIATFVVLVFGGLALLPVAHALGAAMLGASPILLLIQLFGWADAIERDDPHADWRR